MVRKYRYFGAFFEKQEKWLGEMSQSGLRLIKAGIATYDFEPCKPGEYQYAVEALIEKSFKSVKDYKEFLEGMGYRVLYKNINLNYSYGKVKLRPYGKGMGKIATNPGGYNKEILIVEKRNDGKPFEIKTLNSDKAEYYKNLRNMWITNMIIYIGFTIFATCLYTRAMLPVLILMIICLGLSVIPVVRYEKMVKKYMEYARIEEKSDL